MTLDQLKTRRDAYLAAELRILQSQEYRVGDGGNFRSNRRAELKEVRDAIAELDRQIAALEPATTGRRMFNVVPGRL